MQFAARALARSSIEQQLEQFGAEFVDGLAAVENRAAVQIHVVGLTLPQRGVGRELHRRRGRAAVGRPAPGGEADQVRATGHLSRRRNRVVARCIHEHQAGCLDRLRVFVDFGQVGRPAFGNAAQGLLQHRRQAAGLVAGRRVVVHRGAIAGTEVLPPANALDQLAAHFRCGGSPRQQVFRAVDLRGL